MTISDQIKVDMTQLIVIDRKGTVLESPGNKFYFVGRADMDFASAVGFSSYIALKMFQSYCDLKAGDT